MATMILRTLFIASLIGLAAFGVTGLVSLVPASIAVPVILFVIALPAVMFYLVAQQIIVQDTRRRLQNRNGLWLSEKIRKRGMNLDNQTATRGQNLRSLSFEGFTIRNADLSFAKLSGANCKATDFSKSNLEKARLNRANLKRSRFWKANLNKAKLMYANLRGANLKKADLRGANLKGANLSSANIEDTSLEGAVFNKKTVLPFSRKEAFERGMRFVG